jgi:hypothetical protein
MFITTTSTETALNQVSLKPSNKKLKKEKEFLLTDICPDILKDKKKIKINYKKCKEIMEKHKKTDYYKQCLKYWNRPKRFL